MDNNILCNVRHWKIACFRAASIVTLMLMTILSMSCHVCDHPMHSEFRDLFLEMRKAPDRVPTISRQFITSLAPKTASVGKNLVVGYRRLAGPEWDGWFVIFEERRLVPADDASERVFRLGVAFAAHPIQSVAARQRSRVEKVIQAARSSVQAARSTEGDLLVAVASLMDRRLIVPGMTIGQVHEIFSTAMIFEEEPGLSATIGTTVLNISPKYRFVLTMRFANESADVSSRRLLGLEWQIEAE